MGNFWFYMELNKFFTEIKLKKFPFQKIEETSLIAGIGSCFAEKFLTVLAGSGMSAVINPSGIIYNLHSMCEIIKYAAQRDIFTESELDLVNNRYILWSHHGSFGSAEKEKVLSAANWELAKFREQLEKADYLFLTPSSSVVYRHIKHDRIVANCHKANNNDFQVELLDSSENKRLLREILECVKTINPKCKVIVSLSPIRHYPGDLILNSRSKANLLSAIYDCLTEFEDRAVYFPAYEIVHDELRDYRFYASDMLHLNEVAERFVFEKFSDWALSDGCKKFLCEAEKQKKLENHRKKY